MRLWAGICSITLDELAPHVGDVADIAVTLSPSYIGDDDGNCRWPLNLSALGERQIVPLPNLSRTSVAIRGTLEQQTHWLISAEMPINLFSKGFERSIELALRGEPRNPCQAIGQLGVYGTEFGGEGLERIKARILRFHSFCLFADRPEFGQWIEVGRYGDLRADPDVIGDRVCLVEFEPWPA